MRFLLVTACIALAAVVLATGGTPLPPDQAPPGTQPVPDTGVIRTGKTLGPLSPDEVDYTPVTVPEPVWASVLAACAVIILRRGRQ